MKKITSVLIFLESLLISGLFSCSKTDSPAGSSLSSEPLLKAADVIYTPGDPTEFRTLDIYYRSGETSRPVVIFIPGFLWKLGSKDQYGFVANSLTGIYHYIMVIIDYRLSEPGSGSAVHPDHIRDVADAFAWVKQNIHAYGGNPGNIFLMGHSSGGHLAALLASDEQYLEAMGYSEQDIRGVISVSGIYSLADLVRFPLNPLGLHYDQVNLYSGILTGAFGSYDSLPLESASPSHHIHDSVPAFLLLFSEKDLPGFAPDAKNYFARLNEAGLSHNHVYKIFQSDYSGQTWMHASVMAAAYPEFAAFAGHYAGIVAVNDNDHRKVPTIWIVDFIEDHSMK